MDDFKSLQVKAEKDILWVNINRIQDRNSINSELMMEITSFLDMADKSASRVIVFSGAGDSYFIGGADGIEMMQLSPKQAGEFSTKIQNFFNRIEQSPLITVAAINGLCFGGGYEFALSCDLRVASENARIGLPEVKVGLIPGGGGTQRLPRLVGTGLAMEMILTGKLYKGREAEELGLVNLCVQADRLKEGVESLLTPVLKNPQYALSLAKSAVQASRIGSIEKGLEVESERFSHCLEHDFFPELMKKQLKDGSLTTTEDTSSLLNEENK